MGNQCPICMAPILPTEEEIAEWREMLLAVRKEIIDPRLIHDAVLPEVVGDYEAES